MELHKISKIIALVLGVLSVVFSVVCMATEVTLEGSIVDYFIYLSYLAMFVTVCAVLYYVIINFINDKDKKGSLISIGAFLGLLLVSFIIADGTAVPLKDGQEIGPMYSKLISTGLNAFYIIGVASIVTLLYSSFGKIKK